MDASTPFSSSEKFACETFKGEALTELGVSLAHLSEGVDYSPVLSPEQGQNLHGQSTKNSAGTNSASSGTSTANVPPRVLAQSSSQRAPQQGFSVQQAYLQQLQQNQQQSNPSSAGGSGVGSNQGSTSQGTTPGAGQDVTIVAAPSSQAPIPQAPITSTKDQSIIDLLQALTKQVLASNSGSTSASKMGYASWDPITQQAVLALTSPDPAIPATAPCPELLEFCSEATGTSMAQKCSTKYPSTTSLPTSP